MRNFLLVLLCCVTLVCTGLAQQQNDANTPATKADIDRYLEVTHARQMVRQMMDAMSKPMHQFVHEQYEKDKDKLPPDFEERMNKQMDNMFLDMPWDDMVDAMIPAYQKHFTKGDVDALIAFYSTPTGQKILREMPAITAEAMQTMMPIMRTHIEKISGELQAEIAQMKKDNGTKPAPGSPASN